MIRLIHLVLLLTVIISPSIVGAAEEARNYPLGPIGGQYRISGGDSYARVVSLTAGAPGETAGLQVGDFIIGAFGKPFTATGSYHYGVSQDLGFAVDRAEGGSGELPLHVLRSGTGGMAITVNLPAAGAFSPAYPRNDAKSAEMYESSVAWLHTTAMNSNGSMGYFTGWTGLALVGHPNWNDTTGAKPYRLSINKIRDYVIGRLYNNNYAPNENLLLDGTDNPNHLGGMSNWRLGQKVMFLAELWAKSQDNSPIDITVGGETSTVTLSQALQRGAEMCANSVQWWKQPAQHSNGFSPEYDRVAGMSSHGGVTGDYMHQGWFSGVNMTGVYGYNAMAFSRRAGMDMDSRPKDGHYFGFNLNPGDPIPPSIANALPSSITLPQYAEDPVLGSTITDPFWYDPSVNQKFLMRLNFLARRSAWYSAGHNEDGKVGYAPESITHYDAGGRTPGTLLGMAMYQQDVGGLDSADLNRMESLKGYITRHFMKQQEAHAYCVGAQAYQALCAPYLSDRQQRYFMDNWRFYFALSRTHTGGFQYFRSRSTADNYLNETHCAALNAALPYGIANGGYSLIPAYKADRLLARFDDPNMTWPSLAARSLKVTTTSAAIPFQMVDGDGQLINPADYTATWTKLGGAGAVSFGPDTTITDQPVTVFNQNNPPDSSDLPSGGHGSYRGFGFRANDTALTADGGPLTAPDLLLTHLTIRRSASAGSPSSGAVHVKVYSSQTPGTATWIGDSTNTGNLSGGTSEANVTFNFDSLSVQAGTTYYFYFANTAGNLDPAAITWNTGRLRVSNNSAHTYPSGNLINTSWGNQDTAFDAVFSSSIQMRTYNSPATNSDTLTFPADNSYRIQLTVTNGDHTLVEPIDVIVDTTPVSPSPPMAFTAQPQPASADPGDTITLTVATTGPSPALYQWRRSGIPIGSPSASPTLTLSNVSGGAEGIYDCIFTTELGTLISETATVTINGIGAVAHGGLWREVYTGISGSTLDNLIESSKFPFFADSSGTITSATSPSNFADNFGERWTGWIRPLVSGNYRFYLASDDDSELWISPNEVPADAVRILALSGYTNEKQWSARSPSAYIPLIAGVRYSIEVRHKEGGGADHCALAWQLQGDAAPVNGSGEIPGAVLEYRVGGLFADTVFELENQPPVFASDPLLFPPAAALLAYTGGSLATHASDPDEDDGLTFSKLSGPAWLTVAAVGTLGGTPVSSDAGGNTFTVRVTDTSGASATTTLVIEVAGADFHFDLNGTSAGSGAAGGGAWAGAATWSADPLGESATFAWVDGATALFSAGDDANAIYQITLDDVKTVGSWVARTGEPQLSGGGLMPAAADTPFAVLTAAASIGSPISGSARGLTKTGPGTLTLTGNNTYSGPTAVGAGTLRIGDGGSIGDVGSGAVNVAEDATLEFHLQSSHLRDYKTTAKMRTVSGSGGIRLDGGFTFFNFPGTGSGFAEFNSWNNLSGTLAVTGGSEFRTIRNGRTAMGSGQVILGNTTTSGHLAQIEGNWTWTNDIHLAGPANQIRNRSVTAPRTLKLQGVISGSGGLTFADITGAMNQINRGFILTGANTLAGNVTIQSGVPVRVGGVPGETDVSQSAAGISGSLGTATILNQGTLTFSRTNAHTVENHISGAGTLRFGIPATAGFGDTTSQLITYTGSASHTGTSTVHNGALVIANGASLGGATVTVETTGSLGGSGTVNAPLIIQSGAVLAPSPNATLSTGPLTLMAGAGWHVAAAGGSHGMVLVNGNAALNGAHLVVAGVPTGTTRVLLQYSGTRNGEFNASESTLPDGWEITYHDDLGEVRLSAIAPPGGYVSWIAAYETGGLDGFEDDADNDGIANGLEFVLHGGDPLTPRSAVLPAINANAQGVVRFTFLRAARARGHASIVVELSDDLTNWPENRHLAVGETTATSDPGIEVIPHEDHDEITVALPQDAPRTFVRIRVIE